MRGRNREFIAALLVYMLTITVLLVFVYTFLDYWHLSAGNFLVAGVLVFLIAIGWGYVLISLILTPKMKREDTLITLSNDIVHELNIPLSTISANVSMLKRSIEDEKSHKRLQRIEDASVRLARLYDELVYTLRKEIHEIPKERFDLKQVVEERVAIFEEQARNTFELGLESYMIEADKIGFEQMLDNILTNAMKYSPKASLISLSLNEDILTIKDKGIGMNPHELLRIHERYFQGDESAKGKGIGLALVKTYCESENIAIVIESEKGIGTSVCLRFDTMQDTRG